VETYDAIVTRRSVPKLTDQVPTKDQIERVLEAGVRAPTHHLTQPWRFIVLAGDEREAFGDAWAAGTEREGKRTDGVRDKAFRAPVILCVIAQPHMHHPKVIQEEEHYAVGMAMQNILLAAHDMGLGAMIRTGPAVSLKEVRDLLGVGDDEQVAGLIYIGFPAQGDADRPTTRRTPATEITEWRGWS
jgi:nitroreductase